MVCQTLIRILKPIRSSSDLIRAGSVGRIGNSADPKISASVVVCITVYRVLIAHDGVFDPKICGITANIAKYFFAFNISLSAASALIEGDLSATNASVIGKINELFQIAVVIIVLIFVLIVTVKALSRPDNTVLAT